MIGHYKPDLIPVDVVANSLIVTGWHTATHPEEHNLVLNITSSVTNPIEWNRFMHLTRESALQSPSIKLIRPVAANPTLGDSAWGRAKHQFYKFFSHTIFAYIFDFILWATGNKQIIVKLTDKMNKAFEVLEHFTTNQWNFQHDNYNRIFQKLSSVDQATFQSNLKSIDWKEYCNTLVMGNRRYLLKEDDSTIEAGLKRQKTLNNFYDVVNSSIYLSCTGIGLYIGKEIFDFFSLIREIIEF